MKLIRLVVLENDVNAVLEFLGHSAVMQFSQQEGLQTNQQNSSLISADETVQTDNLSSKPLPVHLLEQIKSAALWLGISVPEEPSESSHLPRALEEERAKSFVAAIQLLQEQENTLLEEKHQLESTINEARSFSNLNAPFADLDQLSYLTLRIGRLDPKRYAEVEESLAGHAVFVHLDNNSDRILAATSRKGRFALDTELKKYDFIPLVVPEASAGIPEEVFSGLEAKVIDTERALTDLTRAKVDARLQWSSDVQTLISSYLLEESVQTLKEKLVATKSAYFLSGWVPSDALSSLIVQLERLTGNRIAIRVFEPSEVASVQEVPVSIKHGVFVRGFEPLIFSYGAPLYGTIDPTPFVAFFFTLLFGIMFGDVGQGLVLFLLGFLTGKKDAPILKGYRHFSAPLKMVGCASMVMGLLYGSVFSNETLLEGPTRAITGALTGHPVDRILHLMPDADNMTKIFYFFGFTIGIGAILNSIGLVINIINQMTLKHYEHAFFSKTGLAGALFFWYALFIAVRIILGGHFIILDMVCLIIPMFFIFFRPVLWHLICGERPLFEEGLLSFVIEGIVEIIETVSNYLSNTVSFLRVGAFALSHVILSFIVFTMAGKVSSIVLGPVLSLIIMVFGNLVIILLEGMIVAIQVVRLQYYEFFGKFFTETGVKFAPFRFRKEKL
ncbi:MAG: V-type ATP synthase subunit I [Spirochaetaceae bacterium]|nr:V-type ATP synthase subunit I [Spirochaetaceae bacterium]